MNKRLSLIAVLFSLILTLFMPTLTHAQTTNLQTDFTYQGFLSNAGGAVNASCNFQFSLFNAATSGTQIGTTQTVNAVAVTNGAFSVQLDFGADAFNGQDRYLQIAVQCPGGDTTFVTLSPRQPVTPAPYAGYALSVPWTGITGVPAGFADGIDNVGDDWNSLTNIPPGFADGIDDEGWSLTGNAGTTPGTNFIGTTDDVALEFFVNNLRGLRIEPADDGSYSGNNIIGGYSGNTLGSDVVGAIILGGGQVTDGSVIYANSVTDDFGVLSGGLLNLVSGFAATVGGGQSNTASGFAAIVGGGQQNTASEQNATVGGGSNNTASSFYATVGGGSGNIASGESATVGGGAANNSTNFYTTVGGGTKQHRQRAERDSEWGKFQRRQREICDCEWWHFQHCCRRLQFCRRAAGKE